MKDLRSVHSAPGSWLVSHDTAWYGIEKITGEAVAVLLLLLPSFPLFFFQSGSRGAGIATLVAVVV